MKSRSCKLAVEVLEDRSVPSTVAYGDFNNDGRDDIAEITSRTTITVSLANPSGGGYTVSAILTTPKNQPIYSVYVGDFEGDGDLDISAISPSNGVQYGAHKWLGNGDGTFDPRISTKIWSLKGLGDGF